MGLRCAGSAGRAGQYDSQPAQSDSQPAQSVRIPDHGVCVARVLLAERASMTHSPHSLTHSAQSVRIPGHGVCVARVLLAERTSKASLQPAHQTHLITIITIEITVINNK